MTLLSLIKRNIKLFFKDKGLVIGALVGPIILIVLYFTFLMMSIEIRLNLLFLKVRLIKLLMTSLMEN